MSSTHLHTLKYLLQIVQNTFFFSWKDFFYRDSESLEGLITKCMAGQRRKSHSGERQWRKPWNKYILLSEISLDMMPH